MLVLCFSSACSCCIKLLSIIINWWEIELDECRFGCASSSWSMISMSFTLARARGWWWMFSVGEFIIGVCVAASIEERKRQRERWQRWNFHWKRSVLFLDLVAWILLNWVVFGRDGKDVFTNARHAPAKFFGLLFAFYLVNDGIYSSSFFI